MAVGGVSGSGTPLTSALGGPQASALGKDQFLKLLIAQLQAQDPLNPTQDTEFVAQLAQFSSLEQLTNVNATLEGVTAAQDRMAATQATSMLGKTVTAIGDRFDLAQGAETDLKFFLEKDAKDVKLEVLSSDGRVVRTLTAGNQGEGLRSIHLDGKDQNGNALAAGEYKFRVSAKDADGNSVSALTTIQGTVTGVEFDAGLVLLSVGSRKFQLQDVLEVRQTGTGTGGA